MTTTTFSMRLPPDHLQQCLGVSRTLHLNLGRRAIDVTKVLRREMHVQCAEVLLETMTLRRARNRYDPGLLCQQPGQRDLCGRRVLARSERLQPLDEREVCFPVLLREAGHDIAEIGR